MEGKTPPSAGSGGEEPREPGPHASSQRISVPGTAEAADSTRSDRIPVRVQGAAGNSGTGWSPSNPTLPGNAAELRRLGRFVLMQQLGAGSMGAVYAAYDERLDRKVAIKLLHRAGSPNSAQRRRIRHEAKAMARVTHPNVVSVYDVGEVEDQIFIAMERVDGVPLSMWQRQATRSWLEVVRIYLQAGEGLLAVHNAGLVHRDFKPDNVLVGGDGRAQVTDFGLAQLQPRPKPVPELAATSGTHSVPGESSPHISALSVAGTPGYMSPEQYVGTGIDARSDQFSFCAALYQALYGELPFPGESLAEEAANVIAGRMRPRPAPGRGVPDEIYEALRRGLSPDPSQRFPSMAELLNALEVELGHTPSGAGLARRRYARILVATLVVLMVARELTVDPTHRDLRGAALSQGALLLMHLLCGFLVRRSLLRNTFHRGLYVTIAIVLGIMLGTRIAALAVGIPTYSYLTVDLVFIAGFVALVAYHFLPSVIWLVPPLLLGSFLIGRYGPGAARVGPVMVTLTASWIILAWDRAAARRTARAERGGAPLWPSQRSGPSSFSASSISGGGLPRSSLSGGGQSGGQSGISGGGLSGRSSRDPGGGD